MGNALEGPGWHIESALRGSDGTARRYRQGVREENAEDARSRNRPGFEPGKGGVAVTRIRDLHEGWMSDPDYRKEYDALEGEFALAGALVRARADAGLTQEQLAERMGTKQEVIARWEGGKVLPSTRTLSRLAKATGTTLTISFARPRRAFGV